MNCKSSMCLCCFWHSHDVRKPLRTWQRFAYLVFSRFRLNYIVHSAKENLNDPNLRCVPVSTKNLSIFRCKQSKNNVIFMWFKHNHREMCWKGSFPSLSSPSQKLSYNIIFIVVELTQLVACSITILPYTCSYFTMLITCIGTGKRHVLDTKHAFDQRSRCYKGLITPHMNF